MIKNIVFDIGNVLFGYDPTYILHQVLRKQFHNEYNPFHQFTIIARFRSWTPGRVIVSGYLNDSIPDPNLEDNLQLILHNFITHLHLIDGSRTLFYSSNECIPFIYCQLSSRA